MKILKFKRKKNLWDSLDIDFQDLRNYKKYITRKGRPLDVAMFRSSVNSMNVSLFYVTKYLER